ncbi:MAG: tRNA pseudouridine(55) synthase TruB [Pseudomonadota bacterium]
MARQRKRKGDPVHGWLNLYKPLDMTSTQAVGALKRLYNAQKVGHGGTLDPLADGVLPIAFGEATKTVNWAMEADKEYVFTVEWGVSTESQDKEGAVIATSDVRPSPEAVGDALKAYVGDIEQVPPKYSAIKVDGARAYDLARDGEAFELERRPVTVYEAEVADAPDAAHVVLRVCCGKGFYVRALARDLAADLGAEGHVSQLRRTRVGGFEAANATPLSEIEDMADAAQRLAALAPVQAPLDDVPALPVDPAEMSQLKQGRAIVLLPHVVEVWRAEQNAEGEGDRLALALCGDTAVALGEVRAGRFQPTRVFQI